MAVAHSGQHASGAWQRTASAASCGAAAGGLARGQQRPTQVHTSMRSTPRPIAVVDATAPTQNRMMSFLFASSVVCTFVISGRAGDVSGPILRPCPPTRPEPLSSLFSVCIALLFWRPRLARVSYKGAVWTAPGPSERRRHSQDTPA